MHDNKKYDAFLSLNSQDRSAVEKIAYWLQEKENLSIWLYTWNVIPGDPLQEGMEQALSESNCCVIFLGPSGLGPWQNEEMRTALADRVSDTNFRVIPVLLPNGNHSANKWELPSFLRRLAWVEFDSSLQDEDALHRLVCGIRGIPPRSARANISQYQQLSLPKLLTSNFLQLFKRFLGSTKNLAFAIFCLLLVQTISWFNYRDTENERRKIAEERSKLLDQMSNAIDKFKLISDQETEFYERRLRSFGTIDSTNEPVNESQGDNQLSRSSLIPSRQTTVEADTNRTRWLNNNRWIIIGPFNDSLKMKKALDSLSHANPDSYSFNIIKSLSIDSNGDIFAGTSSGIFRSMDTGNNWSDFDNDGDLDILLGQDGSLLTKESVFRYVLKSFYTEESLLAEKGKIYLSIIIIMALLQLLMVVFFIRKIFR